MELKKQAVLISFGSLVLLGCQWLISVAIVRVSGYRDAGIFSLAMSISNVFASFANYGMRNLQMTDGEKRFSPNQYVLARAASCAASCGGCLVYLHMAKAYTAVEGMAILLYLCYSLSFLLSDIIMGNIQMKGHLEVNGISNAARGLLCFCLFLSVQILTHRLLLALLAMACGSLMVLLAYDVRAYRRFCAVRGTLDVHAVQSIALIFRQGFFLMLTTLVPILITAAPRKEVLTRLGEEQLGIFSTVYTPTVVLNTLIPSLLLASVPLLTQRWGKGELRALKGLILRCYGLVLGLTGAALAAAAFCGRLFLQLLFGPEILAHSGLLYAAVVTIGMNCLSVCGGNVLISFGHRRMTAVIAGASLTTLALLTGRWVADYGIYGAAYVQLATYAVQALAQMGAIFVLLRRRRREKHAVDSVRM